MFDEQKVNWDGTIELAATEAPYGSFQIAPQRGADIVLQAGEHAGQADPSWDGEIVLRAASGQNCLRLTSTGFYVMFDGVERKCQDPDGVYRAFADFLVACLPIR